jgi:hypothetical protein
LVVFFAPRGEKKPKKKEKKKKKKKNQISPPPKKKKKRYVISFKGFLRKFDSILENFFGPSS